MTWIVQSVCDKKLYDTCVQYGNQLLVRYFKKLKAGLVILLIHIFSVPTNVRHLKFKFCYVLSDNILFFGFV